MLIEFWGKVLHYLYFPEELILYLDVCVRLLFSLYYLPLWGIVFAILHSALESIVYTLIVPAALEVQRSVQLSGRSYLEAAAVAVLSEGTDASRLADSVPSSLGKGDPEHRLLLGSQVLDSLVPTFLAPMLSQVASDLPTPLRLVLESIVVVATLIPYGALAVASCAIGHKVMTVIIEAMVDAFSRLEDGKDYPLVAARLRFVSKNPRRFTIFTVVCLGLYALSFGLITTAAVVEYADRPVDVVLVSGAIISVAIAFMAGTAVYNAPKGLRYFITRRSTREASSPPPLLSPSAKNARTRKMSDAAAMRQRRSSYTKSGGGGPLSPPAGESTSAMPSLLHSPLTAGNRKANLEACANGDGGLPPSSFENNRDAENVGGGASALQSITAASGVSTSTNVGGPSADDIDLGISEYDDTDGYYREGRKRYHFMHTRHHQRNGDGNNNAMAKGDSPPLGVGGGVGGTKSPASSVTSSSSSSSSSFYLSSSEKHSNWAQLAIQERRIRRVDRFLPCPSPEFVSYITGPWWEGNIHKVRHMAVEALVVYFFFSAVFGPGPIATAPKAVEIMIYLNFPHLLGFLALAVSESIVRKSHTLLWLLRHLDQFPAIFLVSAPYLVLLIYCMSYFFPAPLPTGVLLFAAVHQFFRAVDLARWYEVSPQGGGVQWVEHRPAAPPPQVVAAALSVLSGKMRRPLFVPQTPSVIANSAMPTARRRGSNTSTQRQTSEDPTSPTSSSAIARTFSSALAASRTNSSLGAKGGNESDDGGMLSRMNTTASAGFMDSSAGDGGSATLRNFLASSLGGEFSTMEATAPEVIPVHDSYAIMLEDARQRGKSDLGIVGLDTAADIGLMRLYRRGQTLPSRLERRVTDFNSDGVAVVIGGAALTSPVTASRPLKGRALQQATNTAPEVGKKSSSSSAAGFEREMSLSVADDVEIVQKQSFYAFAFPRSLLLLGAGSFSGARFSSVRTVQKYLTWSLLSVFVLLLLALALQSVIPALQPSPMGLAIEERGLTRASLDHLIIKLTFLAKGDGPAGTANDSAESCNAEIETPLSSHHSASAINSHQKQAKAANARAANTLFLPEDTLTAMSPFAPANHSIGAWPSDSEDEYPGLCRANFGNNVSVFELSIFSLLTYLGTAEDVQRVLTFLNANMDTQWTVATSLWANGTFADVSPACWGGGGGGSADSSRLTDEEIILCAEANRSRVRDWNGFIEFHDADREVRVVAVRGTDPTSVMDILQDVNMFFEAALFQVLAGVVPFAGILPTSLATDFIRLASLTDVLSQRSLWDPRHHAKEKQRKLRREKAEEERRRFKIPPPMEDLPKAEAKEAAVPSSPTPASPLSPSTPFTSFFGEDFHRLSDSFVNAMMARFGGASTPASPAASEATTASEEGGVASVAAAADHRASIEDRLKSIVADKASKMPEVLTVSELARATSDRDYHLRVMRYVASRMRSIIRQEEDRKQQQGGDHDDGANSHHHTSSSSSSSPFPPHVRENIIMTGHSMGGAIAHIAGTRLKLRSVAFGSPGIVLSHKKFGIKDIKSVHSRTFTVASSNDIVPLIGWQGGEVHHLECAAKASASELCHVMEFMIGALWHNCPSIRQRYPKIRDVL